MKTLPRITEKQFMAQVVQLARMCRWKVYHTHDSRRSAAGFPDLVCVRGEVVIFAELKVGKNDPTTEQKDWLTALDRAGQRVYLWRPENWKEIEAVLTGEL